MLIAMFNSAPAPSDYFTSGQHFLETTRFSPKPPETQTHGDFNVYFLKQQIWLLLHTTNIPPLHIQQHTLLSQLSHNSISSLYFFPFPWDLQHNANSIFHAAIKNYHKNISTSWNFSLFSIYLTTFSEETTQRKHTHARYNFSSLKISTITSR